MATEIVMPQMGESITEATITRWLVAVGDKVEVDQPILEISTDKVDAEIPSPGEGVILEIRHQEGDVVPVDQVVAILGGEGETAGEDTGSTEAIAGTEPAPESISKEAPPSEAKEAEATPPSAPDEAGDLEKRVRAYSSPLVRKIAREEGVDLEDIKGTGVHGRVTKKDILAFLEQRKAGGEAAQSPAPEPGPAPDTARPLSDFSVPAFVPGEAVEIEKMTNIRQITAAHMTYSKAVSAHVTTMFHVDMTRVAMIRNRAKKAFQAANGTKLTFMPFLFRAVCLALRQHKKVNAAVDGRKIVYKKDINLGMAVALDRGLIVPVIRNADQLSLAGLAETANDLADRARTKKLGPDELTGGTFTVTNPGVFGSLFGTPIINQPQVAIMGVGTIEKRPVVITDADGADLLGIRTMCYLGLTFDHRIVDGADADLFMADVKKTLETDPWSELDSYL
jgi:2-oxoglutarate dehydrogenase E2 component (dihydrolipoamide succinyltransferase)